MIVGSILFLLSGGFFANGVPHYVKGVIGNRHITPFKNPSSAPANVLWGSANFLVGLWIGIGATAFGVPLPLAGTTMIIGGGLIGYALARRWQNNPVAKGESTPT